MDQGLWELLGIEPTRDKKAIKRAYAKRGQIFHPEEHPEEFKWLRKAYEGALDYAAQEPDDARLWGKNQAERELLDQKLLFRQQDKEEQTESERLYERVKGIQTEEARKAPQAEKEAVGNGKAMNHEEAMSYEEAMRHEEAVGYERVVSHEEAMGYERVVSHEEAVNYEEAMGHERVVSHEEAMGHEVEWREKASAELEKGNQKERPFRWAEEMIARGLKEEEKESQIERTGCLALLEKIKELSAIKGKSPSIIARWDAMAKEELFLAYGNSPCFFQLFEEWLEGKKELLSMVAVGGLYHVYQLNEGTKEELLARFSKNKCFFHIVMDLRQYVKNNKNMARLNSYLIWPQKPPKPPFLSIKRKSGIIIRLLVVLFILLLKFSGAF